MTARKESLLASEQGASAWSDPFNPSTNSPAEPESALGEETPLTSQKITEILGDVLNAPEEGDDGTGDIAIIKGILNTVILEKRAIPVGDGSGDFYVLISYLPRCGNKGWRFVAELYEQGDYGIRIKNPLVTLGGDFLPKIVESELRNRDIASVSTTDPVATPDRSDGTTNPKVITGVPPHLRLPDWKG